jgi:subtilisin
MNQRLFYSSLVLALLLASCGQTAPIAIEQGLSSIGNSSNTLSVRGFGKGNIYPRRAAWGEEVEVTLPGSYFSDSDVIQVFIGAVAGTGKVIGSKNPISADKVHKVNAEKIRFLVPKNLWGGPQELEVLSNGKPITKGVLNVLGQSVIDSHNPTVLAVFQDPTLKGKLESQGFMVVNKFALNETNSQLGDSNAPCNGTLYEIVDRKTKPKGSASTTGHSLERLASLKLGSMYVSKNTVDLLDARGGGSIKPSDTQSTNFTPINARNAVGLQQGLDGSGTTIAVLDSGVEPKPFSKVPFNTAESISYLKNSLDPFKDIFENGHGTPVAVLAAEERYGIAPGTFVLSIKACESDTSCSFINIARGICHAVNYAKTHNEQVVLNLSLGSETPSEIVYNILQDALSTKKSNGKPLLLVAAAAGNGWKDRNEHAGELFHYPAAFAGIEGLPSNREQTGRLPTIAGLVAVGAVGSRDGANFEVSDFSNRGDYITLVAPGQQVISLDPSGNKRTYDGTSFATPIVSGTLAFLSKNYFGDAAAIKDQLKQLVRPLTLSSEPTEVGAGMLDLSKL